MNTVKLNTSELTPAARYALLEPTLQKMFYSAGATDYIESINYFVQKRIGQRKRLSKSDNMHLYNLLNLISSLPKLEVY